MPLLDLTKLPTIRKIQALGPDIEKRLAKQRAAADAAFGIDAHLAEASTALQSAESESDIREATQKLLELNALKGDSRTGPAQKVVVAFANIEAERRKREWNRHSGLLQAAFAEIETALREKISEIEKEDAKRSESLGMKVESDEILRVIKHRIENLRLGLAPLNRGEPLEARGFLAQGAEVAL